MCEPGARQFPQFADIVIVSRAAQGGDPIVNSAEALLGGEQPHQAAADVLDSSHVCAHFRQHEQNPGRGVHAPAKSIRNFSGRRFVMQVTLHL
jgi:hypothetical protein